MFRRPLEVLLPAATLVTVTPVAGTVAVVSAAVAGLVVSLALASPAVAGELAGVTLPDQVTVEGKTLLLNGMGLREATFLKIDVYVAGLYLGEKSKDADAIVESDKTRRIVMKFVRHVGRKDLVKAWTEGFDKNAGKDRAGLEERLATLNAWMVDIAKGDTLTFTYAPGKGLEGEVRGQSKGTIAGADFARVFFRIWLGPAPPNPGLKAGLLGQSRSGSNQQDCVTHPPVDGKVQREWTASVQTSTPAAAVITAMIATKRTAITSGLRMIESSCSVNGSDELFQKRQGLPGLAVHGVLPAGA